MAWPIADWKVIPHLIGVFFLSGCSGLAVVDAVTPAQGYVRTADIAYGVHPRQTLDIYRPAPAGVADSTQRSDASGDGAKPVVVFFYGGSWKSGDRAAYRFVGQVLADWGYIAVIPDYRLYPEVRHPDFVQDAAGAVAWTLNRIAEYGGDPARVTVMGHSAGAHLATLVALDSRYLGADRLRLARVIGLSGPYDFRLTGDLPDVLNAAAAARGEVPSPLPVDHVPAMLDSQDGPEFHLIHGTDDTTVAARNSITLHQRITAAGGRATLTLVPDLGHALMVGALSPGLDFLAPDVRRVVRTALSD